MDIPALMLIDVQKGIDDAEHWGGNRNNPSAEKNIESLLHVWRTKKYPVIIVQHASTSAQSPFHPAKPGHALKEFVTPREGERLIVKSATNAFIGTFLHQHLAQQKITELVVTGFVTNNSVEATVRNAGDFGFKTTVVADACACFDKKGLSAETFSSSLVHEMSLANMSGEYAEISSTQQIINKYQ